MPDGAAPLPDDDHARLDGALAAMAREHGLSVSDLLRLQDLLKRLRAAGVRDGDPRMARFLAPVFCSSAREQAEFTERLAGLTDVIESLPESATPSGISRAADVVTRAAGRAVEAVVVPNAGELRSFIARSAHQLARAPAAVRNGLLLVAVALGLLTLAAIVVSRREAPAQTPSRPSAAPVQKAQPKATSPQNLPPAAAADRAVVGPPAMDLDRLASRAGRFFSGPRGLAPIVALTVLIPLAMVVLRRWRRASLRRFAEAMAPSRRTRAALDAALPHFLDQAASHRSVLDLGRFASGGRLRLNVRRSLRATLRRGGLPELRYGGRPRRPEYMLLVDSQSPRDHLPLLGEVLARRMAQHKVAHARFHFYRSPRKVEGVGAMDGSLEGLARLTDVAATRPDARFVVLSEPADLMAAPGRPRKWITELAGVSPTLLLNPRTEPLWGADESALETSRVMLAPATAEGIDRYATWLAEAGDRVPPPRVRPEPSGVDLPFYLDLQRARLLSDDPFTEAEWRRLSRDLHGWLGPDLYRLLQATAVLPRLEPGFTLALGRVLPRGSATPDPDASWEAMTARLTRLWRRVLGPAFVAGFRISPVVMDLMGELHRAMRLDQRNRIEPVLDDDNLLRIIRLPWMRAGRMPMHLRRRLAQDLEPEDLALAAELAHGFLVADEQALRLGGRERRRLRRRDILIDWLKSLDESDLNDAVLVDALSGVPAAQLGTSPPPPLRRRIVRWVAGRPGLLMLAASAIVVVGSLLFVAAFVHIAPAGPSAPAAPPPAPPPTDPGPVTGARAAPQTPAQPPGASAAGPAVVTPAPPSGGDPAGGGTPAAPRALSADLALDLELSLNLKAMDTQVDSQAKQVLDKLLEYLDFDGDGRLDQAEIDSAPCSPNVTEALALLSTQEGRAWERLEADYVARGRTVTWARACEIVNEPADAGRSSVETGPASTQPAPPASAQSAVTEPPAIDAARAASDAERAKGCVDVGRFDASTANLNICVRPGQRLVHVTVRLWPFAETPDVTEITGGVCGYQDENTYFCAAPVSAASQKVRIRFGGSSTAMRYTMSVSEFDVDGREVGGGTQECRETTRFCTYTLITKDVRRSGRPAKP